MIIVALLIVALALLIAGLLLASAPLLIGSLAASLIAGALVLRMRSTAGVRKSAPAHTEKAAESTPSSPAASESAVAKADPPVWVIDGRPRYHRADCEIVEGAVCEAIPHSQAIEDGFIACSLCQPDVVRSA
jgi:hypothetical protein